MLGLEDGVAFNDLASVSGCPAHDSSERTHCAIECFIEWLVVADRVKKVVVFLLVRGVSFDISALVVGIGASYGPGPVAEIGLPLRADQMFGYAAPAAANVPALAEEL